jgi:transposase
MQKDTMAKLIERGAIMERLAKKEITQTMAAFQLDISTRQIRRLYGRYKAEGSNGLIHKNYGRQSPRKSPKEIELNAVAWLKEYGPDFGSTFAQEKLAEYVGIKVSVSTVRNWQRAHGLLKQKHKADKQQFKRRERKQYFGQMVQIDGSPHDWFSGRGPRCMLLTAIDDATGTIMARFASGETTEDLMRLMWQYIELYGIPHVAYTDHGGPYKVNINNQERDKMTQLHRALHELGMELIHANSPQAKGRVERNHQTNQDRLVKELTLRNISTIEEANRYLLEEYLHQFNKRFVVAPARAADVHKSAKKFDLSTIFSIQEKRIVQNDGVVQFNKQLYQITKNRIYTRAKTVVTIKRHLDGSTSIWTGSIQLGFEIIAQRVKEPAKTPPAATKQRKVTQSSRDWNNGVYTPPRLR